MRSTSAVILLTFALAARADDKIDVAIAVEQAKAVAKAVFDEEFEKVVASMHPKIVEMAGGKAKLIATIKDEVKKKKGLGWKLTMQSVGKPGNPVFDGKTAYLIIPTTLEWTINESKVVSESYLVGVSTDNGKTWVFVDGAGMDQMKIRDEVFPKLPEGLKLPEKKPPGRDESEGKGVGGGRPLRSWIRQNSARLHGKALNSGESSYCLWDN